MRGRLRRRPDDKPYAVSLTSLMDIVTNILVYTIKIFAVSTIMVQDPSIDLPFSSTKENPEDSVVVMLTEHKKVAVDGKILDLKDLRHELTLIKSNQKRSADLIKGSGFTGRVVIVADKLTPYHVLVDVLTACGDIGFCKFEFAVVKQEA